MLFRSLSVPVWEAGVNTGAKVKLEAATARELLNGDEYKVKYGRLHVTLPAKSACVFSCKFSHKQNSGQQMSIFK